MKGSAFVKWPESTMTLDRQGAVAVCDVGCQQNHDWLEEIGCSIALVDLPGLCMSSLRDLGVLAQRRSSAKGKENQERSGPEMRFET